MKLARLGQRTFKLGSRQIDAWFVAFIGMLTVAFLTGTVIGLRFNQVRFGTNPANLTCSTSRPSSGAYSVTLCIANPTDHATVAGDVQVSLRVTIAGRHPNVQEFLYFFDGAPVQAEVADDGSLLLETDHFEDGQHSLSVSARMADNFVSTPTTIEIIFDNGVTQAQESAPTVSSPDLSAAPTLASPTSAATFTPVPATPTRRPPATRAPKAPATLTPTITPAPTDTPDASANIDTSGGGGNVVDNSNNGGNDGSQSCVGSISGHVTNNGAPVANVYLTLSDSANASTDTSPTDSTGYYLFPGLVDGTYAIALVVPTGFRAASTTANVTVASCSNPTQNFAVTAGSATATPTVTPRLTATATMTATASVTATLATPSRTTTATATLTPTATTTPTLAGTPTPTRTPSPTRTATATRTSTPSATRTATSTPTSRTITLTPAADAYVNQSFPTTNYGVGTSLRVAGSPSMNGYIKFNVQGLTGTIKSVTLRVYSNSSSSVGYAVRGVANNTWSETGITYANAPVVSSTSIGTSGGFATGAWTYVNVTSYLAGNGTYSFALTTTGAQINLASRESGAKAPQLVIVTQ